MDLQMPEMSGTEAISEIRSEFHDARIIALTTYSGDAQILKALRAGARVVKRELASTVAEASEHRINKEQVTRHSLARGESGLDIYG